MSNISSHLRVCITYWCFSILGCNEAWGVLLDVILFTWCEGLRMRPGQCRMHKCTNYVIRHQTGMVCRLVWLAYKFHCESSVGEVSISGYNILHMNCFVNSRSLLGMGSPASGHQGYIHVSICLYYQNFLPVLKIVTHTSHAA